MIVGRAVNGWEVKFDDCTTLDATLNSVLNQPVRLDDFAKDYTVDEKGQKYYYAKSPFLRFIKTIVTAFEGSKSDWTQKFVWSNLYKIAPRNGGNPSSMMYRKNLQTYIDIVEQEIDTHKPDIVIFCTDMNYFDPYPNKPHWPTFKSLFAAGTLQEENLPQYVVAEGTYYKNSKTKLIVCKRPERRPVQEIVESIVKLGK